MEPTCAQEVEALYTIGCNSLPQGQQLRGSYQIDGVKFMLEHELVSSSHGAAGARGGIQADDMGMGKTNMAIFIVQVSVGVTRLAASRAEGPIPQAPSTRDSLYKNDGMFVCSLDWDIQNINR